MAKYLQEIFYTGLGSMNAASTSGNGNIVFNGRDHEIYIQGDTFKGTDTTYSASNGLEQTGTEFSHKAGNGVAQSTWFNRVQVDQWGHVVSADTNDEDTHWTSYMYAGSNTGAANQNTVSNPYLKLFENDELRSLVRLVGSSGIGISSDTNGNVTFVNTLTDTWRPIIVGGDTILDSSSDSSALSLKAGENVQLAADGAEVTISATDTVYTLPHATTDALGGVRLGYQQTNKNYPLLLDADDKAYVTVDWTDTDTWRPVTVDGTNIPADQGFVLVPGSNISMSVNSSTYEVTVNNTYTLPEATSTALGGIKTGFPVNDADRNYPVALNTSNQAYVNVPWADTWRPVKVNGTAVDASVEMRWTAGSDILITKSAGSGYEAYEIANTYSLPVAASDTLGGVKLGYTTDVVSKNFAVTKDASDNIYVNVPWINTWRSVSAVDSSNTEVTINSDAALKLKSGTNMNVSANANGEITFNNTYSYSLPLAASGTRGGIKIGFTTDNNNRNYAVALDSEKAYVNVPWINTWRPVSVKQGTSVTAIDTSVPFGIKGGNNISVEVETDGDVKYAKISNTYSLPHATTDVLGGIRIGYDTSEIARNYAVQLDANDKAYVNVPWADTWRPVIVKNSAGTEYSIQKSADSSLMLIAGTTINITPVNTSNLGLGFIIDNTKTPVNISDTTLQSMAGPLLTTLLKSGATDSFHVDVSANAVQAWNNTSTATLYLNPRGGDVYVGSNKVLTSTYAPTAFASSVTMGGTRKPIWISSGTITEFTGNTGGENRPVYISNGELTAGNSYVPVTGGAFSGDITVSNTDTTATRITVSNTTANSGAQLWMRAGANGTANIGFSNLAGISSKSIIAVDAAGNATFNGTASDASSATTAAKLSAGAGSNTQPIYIASDGTPTASTGTVGDANTPVRFVNGVITACNSFVPVSGGTFTGGVTNTNADGFTISSTAANTEPKFKLVAPDESVGLIIGGSSRNKGLYDYGKSKWIVYSTSVGDVTLNGNATGTAAGIAGGAAGSLPYQSAAGTTVFLAGTSTNGAVLKYNTSTNVPYWDTDSNTVNTAGATTSNDTSLWIIGTKTTTSNTSEQTYKDPSISIKGANLLTSGTITASFVGDLSGNASTATSADYWTNARTLTVSGDASGSVSIQGNANMSLSLSVDKLSGKSLCSANTSIFGGIPFVESDGVIEIGRYIDMHYDNKNVDYSHRIQTSNDSGTSSYILTLPNKSGTVALTSDISDTVTNYIAKSGDSSIGRLSFSSNMYRDNNYANGALHLNNGDITGINSLVFNDYADDYSEGIIFMRSSSGIDSLYVQDGTVKIYKNGTSYNILDAGNVSSYAVTNVAANGNYLRITGPFTNGYKDITVPYATSASTAGALTTQSKSTDIPTASNNTIGYVYASGSTVYGAGVQIVNNNNKGATIYASSSGLRVYGHSTNTSFDYTLKSPAWSNLTDIPSAVQTLITNGYPSAVDYTKVKPTQTSSSSGYILYTNSYGSNQTVYCATTLTYDPSGGLTVNRLNASNLFYGGNEVATQTFVTERDKYIKPTTCSSSTVYYLLGVTNATGGSSKTSYQSNGAYFDYSTSKGACVNANGIGIYSLSRNGGASCEIGIDGSLNCSMTANFNNNVYINNGKNLYSNSQNSTAYFNYVEIGNVTKAYIPSNTSTMYVVGTTASPGNSGYLKGHSNFYFTSSGAYHTSDRRSKENIINVREDILKVLDGSTGMAREFDLKDSGEHKIGYIAQEILDIIPEAVNYDNNSDRYAVDYNTANVAMIAALTIKVKKQDAEIKTLRNEITNMRKMLMKFMTAED